jgi:hypothetical protein
MALVASTATFDGTVTAGLVVSTVVTVNEALLRFARVSIAVQSTVVVPSGKVAPLAGVQVTATAPSTASLPVALNVKAAPVAAVASTVAFGGSVITGALVSATVTVNCALAELPRLSAAVHVTLVLPSAKVAPLAGVQATVTAPSTMSVADDVKVNAAPAALVASTVAFDGIVNTGAMVSTTVTVNDCVVLFPATSLAAQLTVVTPSAKVEPLFGVQVTATGPSTVSTADDVKLKDTPLAEVASSDAFAGTVTTGPSVSTTVTVNVAVALLLVASVALQVTVVAPRAKVEPLAGAHVTATAPSTRSFALAV